MKEYYHLNFFRKKKYLEITNIIAKIKPQVEELEDKVEKNLPESRGKRKKWKIDVNTEENLEKPVSRPNT